jgi:hypothetical protein
MAASVLSLLHFMVRCVFLLRRGTRARKQVYACGSEVESAGTHAREPQDPWDDPPIFPDADSLIRRAPRRPRPMRRRDVK